MGRRDNRMERPSGNRMGGSEQLEGIVKKKVIERGFGFLIANGGEFFFHRSACDDFDALQQGDRVMFTPGNGSKGPRAENVTLA